MKDMLFLLQSAAGHCVIRIYRETAPNSIISRDSIDLVATGRQSELFFTLSDLSCFCFFLILSHSNDRRSESNFLFDFCCVCVVTICFCRRNVTFSIFRVWVETLEIPGFFCTVPLSGGTMWTTGISLDMFALWRSCHVPFSCTWKTLEAIASSYFYLDDCLPDVEGLNRRPDLSIIIHWRRPTGTIPPFFFFAWRIPFMFVCVGILGFGYCGRCCWKVSCQVAYSFQRHLTW